MSHLVSCQSISKAFGAQELFSGITIGFSRGERLGLIGPNGAGKSTLMKILCGIEAPDSGKVFVTKGVRLGYLAQEDDLDDAQTVEECLVQAAAGASAGKDAWEEAYAEARRAAGMCGFLDPGRRVGDLSGGWRKRLAVGRALAAAPDLLMMDEPTNHLDMEGVLWLENILRSARFAFVVISHDRVFLNNVTNRMVELSRRYPGGYLRVEGSYQELVRRKKELLDAQEKTQASLANKLRRELEWLARGPKARTGKARFRVHEAGRLRRNVEALRERNAHGGKIGVAFTATERKTKKLVTVRGVGKTYDGRPVFTGLDLTLAPSTCVGILGNNGSGKTTLMHILAGRVAPDQGTVKYADGLKIALFDQKRQDLDQEQTLRRALAPDGDSIVYQGRGVHVVGWAKRFLFRPDQLDMPVARLSGGEQARILLANLMRLEVDVLLLDEPTNDLDIPSLDVLAEGLEAFPGAVVLVSHDRFLLGRLADYVIGLDGRGGWGRYADAAQWLAAMKESGKKGGGKAGSGAGRKDKARRKKLTLGEELELAGMEEAIAGAEEALAAKEREMERPDVRTDADRLAACWEEVRRRRDEVERLYARWEELEDKASGTGAG